MTIVWRVKETVQKFRAFEAQICNLKRLTRRARSRRSRSVGDCNKQQIQERPSGYSFCTITPPLPGISWDTNRRGGGYTLPLNYLATDAKVSRAATSSGRRVAKEKSRRGWEREWEGGRVKPSLCESQTSSPRHLNWLDVSPGHFPPPDINSLHGHAFN